MGSKPIDAPIVAIVGETASGKSALALALAENFGGEIVCVDSRTIYKGMDIGTAKPSIADQQRVPHHLLDVTTVDNPLTVSDVKNLADKAVADIHQRRRLPILAGGSGLYMDAVLYDFEFAGQADPGRRAELESKTINELQAILLKMNIELPNNPLNPRHLIRQIETRGAKPEPKALGENALILSIDVPKLELDARIERRVAQMLEAGLEREVRTLTGVYGWTWPSMKTIGYQEFRSYIRGDATLAEVQTKIVRHTIQFARRQRQWFKRNKDIEHICNQDQSIDLITTLLNKGYIA